MRRRLPETRRSIDPQVQHRRTRGVPDLWDATRTANRASSSSPWRRRAPRSVDLMDSLGTSTSVALQYGVPLESLVRKFTHQRFEPAGMTIEPRTSHSRSRSWTTSSVGWGWSSSKDTEKQISPRKATSDSEPKTSEAQRQRRTPNRSCARMTSDAIEPPTESKPKSPTIVSASVSETSVDVLGAPTARSASVLVQVVHALHGPRRGRVTRPLATSVEPSRSAAGTCYKCLNCGATPWGAAKRLRIDGGLLFTPGSRLHSLGGRTLTRSRFKDRNQGQRIDMEMNAEDERVTD